MLLSNVTTSFLFLMSHLFWMFPTVILLSKRATAYAPLRIAERALRTRARGPLVSLAPRNNFLIARKSNLEDREVQTLQMIAHWTMANPIQTFYGILYIWMITIVEYSQDMSKVLLTCAWCTMH